MVGHHKRLVGPGPARPALGYATEFIAELRRLARHCEFKTFLDEALRDRFACGLSSKAIQNSLLKKKELTLAKAVELATSMEAAAKEVTELQATATADAATAGALKRDVLKATGVGSQTTSQLTVQSKDCAVTTVVRLVTLREHVDKPKGISMHIHQIGSVLIV